MSFCFLFSHIQQINLPVQNSFIVFSITFFSISVHRFLLPDGEFVRPVSGLLDIVFLASRTVQAQRRHLKCFAKPPFGRLLQV